MRIEFDPAKRQATLAARGLDMTDAGQVFEGSTLTVEDDRRDYGETRFITIGKANGKEQALYGSRLRRSR